MAARGEGAGDDRFFIIIAIMVLLVASVFFFDNIISRWLQSTYQRYLFFSRLPLVGDVFYHGAYWLKSEPTLYRAILLDYFLGWLFAMPVTPFLIKHIKRERQVRSIWSSRPANRKMFNLVIRARGVDPKERQLYQVSEWLERNSLDHEASDFDEKFLVALERQLGAPSNPEDPLLVGFARRLGVSRKLVRLACDKHAYRATVMVRLLHHHRERFGVVSCDWARAILFRHGYPEIWAALASVGRKTVFMEGAGVMAHYYMELGERKPLRDVRLYGCLVIMRRYLGHVIRQNLQQRGLPLPEVGNASLTNV
ncbi:hypothetical protein [Chromobacterium phragmitis]|uniref:secretion/conjugation apparatus DotM-related subunit n=1 Tax=Chromobacterium phragmitis TaxID=2202141 RepID=UPI00326383BF